MKKTSSLILFLIIVIVLLGIALLMTTTPSRSSKIAVIPIDGIIATGKGISKDIADSATISDFIKQADEDDSIKAIILYINSPGGTPVASQEIARAITKTNKPTYAVIREIGTSGAYWVASAADEIYASDISIVGSIGVLASYVEFSGFLENHNVSYQRLVGGEFKDIGSPLKELQPKEREKLQTIIDQLHDYFIEEVATNREMDIAEVTKLATGEFFLGKTAKDLNLIDTIGTLDDVKTLLEQDIGEIELVYFKQPAGLFDIFSGLSSSHGYAIGSALTGERSNPISLT